MALLRIRLSPRSGKNELVALENGVLKARVTAPPVDGAANRALIELLADELGIKRSCIGIRSGASSREKMVSLEGLTTEQVMEMVLSVLCKRKNGGR